MAGGGGGGSITTLTFTIWLTPIGLGSTLTDAVVANTACAEAGGKIALNSSINEIVTEAVRRKKTSSSATLLLMLIPVILGCFGD